MSTAPVASQLEILDLRHFSAKQLRPLLEAEAKLWQSRLLWDYTASTELLLQYLESRVLQGFAAVSGGRVFGYSFAVYEGNKAVIGDAFSSGLGPTQDLYTTRLLLKHVLELLTHAPMVDRVESQLLLADSGNLASVFRDLHARIFPRLFQLCELHAEPAALQHDAALPPGFTLAPWTPQDYQAAGELIHAAYSGHTDSDINDQYRSLHGALRFLHNIVRFPGCGVFEPAYSWVIRNQNTPGLVGLVLASRVGADVAHITQFCISPAHRGHGLGSALLEHTIHALREAGFRAITLTVTESNAAAVHLYQSVGFRNRHRFDAYVIDRMHLR